MNKQLLILLVIILYFFGVSYFYEPNSLKVTKYEIEDNYLQGIRIAFLSDLHLKRNDYRRLNKIVKVTNEQRPDIVFLGGDYANGHDYKKTMDMDLVGAKLSLISAPKYSVLGNHDWWADGTKISSALRRNGVIVLENSHMRTVIKRRFIDIIGLADLDTRKVNVIQAMNGTHNPRIVLMHNPDSYYDIMGKVNLILAGHTHGGQFVLPFCPPIFVPSKYGTKFARGLIKETANKMIVSKGLGTSIVPLRFNCKPEIIIVDFVRVGEAKKTRKR